MRSPHPLWLLPLDFTVSSVAVKYEPSVYLYACVHIFLLHLNPSLKPRPHAVGYLRLTQTGRISSLGMWERSLGSSSSSKAQ